MKLDECLSSLDLEKLVKDSVKAVAPDLREAYVAEPKKFSQVSEFVSQQTKDAHAELYKSYVKQMNSVSAELDTAERHETNSSHSKFRSLKLDETYNVNATYLHEAYFSNAYDPNSQVFMDSKAYMKLSQAWGTFDDWQRDFIACAMSCGNGWAVCGYNLFLQKIVNTFISNHSQDVMIGLYPIVVLDCWEHAYTRDRLNDRETYVVSSMQTLDWNVIEERFVRVEQLQRVFK